MASADTTQLVNLLEGTFDIQGKKCTVTLTSESLKWCKAKGKNKDGVVILVEEILSVTISTEKVKNAGDCHLQLGYIKHKKSNHLGRTTVKLCGSSDVCTKWSHSIQECINGVTVRPKSVLVLVNPISGGRKGPKQYREKVAPVFSEASVKTDVIVTESANHVKEIIDGYDLTSIDSIVVVGGDGMYHLLVDALVQRIMREAGLDLNDSENEVPEVSLPIGIIPCGTGNGRAAGCCGCIDVETAALAVVRGGRQKSNVQCVWSGGEFMAYCSLLHGFGLLADMMYDTTVRRNMGIWRYPVVLGGYLLKSSLRVLDLSIEYRPSDIPPPQSHTAEDGSEREGTSKPDTADEGSGREGPRKSNTAQEGSERNGPSKPDTADEGSEREGPSRSDTADVGSEKVGPSKADTAEEGSGREGFSKSETAKDSSVREGSSKSTKTYSQAWQTYNGRVVTLGVGLSDAIGYRAYRDPAYLKSARVYLMKQWGRASYLKFLLHFLTYDPAMLHNDNIDNIPFVEYKVKVNNPEGQGGHANLIHINGEMYNLKEPEYHVKLFPGKLNVFASVTEEFLLDGGF